MLEKISQEQFVALITGASIIPEEKPDRSQNDRLKVYKDLVYYRFYEVLKNIYPLFRKEVGDEAFENLVRRFIGENPREPLIWKMPNEFRNFLCSRKELLPLTPAAEDLLSYEWSEVELLMGDYSEIAKTQSPGFSPDLPLAFSRSARKLKLTFRVYAGDYTSSGEFYVVLYYNFSDYRVHFLEITPFMFDLLGPFDVENGFSPEAALTGTASKYNVSKDEIGEVVFKTLGEYCQKKILVRV